MSQEEAGHLIEWPLFPEYSTQVSAERNLEEYPFFKLKARQRGSDSKTFEKIVMGAGGISLKQVWKVIPSSEYGMPGPVDQDVYTAVQQLLQQRGGMPEDGELHFSLYELRKILGWSDDSGKAYREIRDSLLRIQTTTVQSRSAFYSATEKRRITDSFNVWSVHFVEHETRGAGTRERHTLRFHPNFVRNYMAEYLKGLDAEFYWSLRSALSKRLYRLVDLQRAGGLAWKTDLFAVRDQIPLEYRYPSEIKRQLKTAHEELREKGFLASVEHEGKSGILYRVHPDYARRQKALELSGDPQEMFAVERLLREGVHGESARELVVAHGASKCLFYADAMDTQHGIRNRASWLVSAIKNDYRIPEAMGAVQEPLEATLIDEPTSSLPAAGGSLDPAAAELWASVLQDITAEIDDASLAVWLEGVVPTVLEGETLTLSVPNAFAKEYVEDRFGRSIEGALKERLSDRAFLVVAVDGSLR